MPCYTEVLVTLDDDALTRKARERLGFPAVGALSERDARRVRKEAGVLKAMAEVRRLQPTAIIRRTGDELTVTVNT